MKLAGFVALGVMTVAGCAQEKKVGGAAAPSEDTSNESVPSASEPASDKAAPPHSMLIANAAALPACTASAEGWLVYLKAEAQFDVCSSGAWSAVTIETPDNEAASGAWVLDVEGIRIGQPTSDIALGGFNVVLDGSSILIRMKSLAGGVDVSEFDYYETCRFESSDCTGACFVAQTEKAAITMADVFVPTEPAEDGLALNSRFRFATSATQQLLLCGSDARRDGEKVWRTKPLALALPLRLLQVGP